tara:strand:+ start:896 stop:2320 length:1425 start_codon:yes stop_codon:yes gene_type:complete
MSDDDETKIIGDYFNNENKNMGFGFYANEMYNAPNNIFAPPQVADDVKTDLSYLDDRAEENLRFANFAEQAYRPLNERTNVDDYEYMPDISNKFIAHFKNDDRQELVHAITGSKYKNDILTDVTLAIPPFASLVDKISKFNPFGEPNDFGFYGDLTKREEQINQVKKKYPKYKNIYSGHSLGGGISTEISKKDPESRAFTFNPAKFPEFVSDIGGDIPLSRETTKKKYPNIYNYRIVGDIVSGAGKLDGKVYNLKILEPSAAEKKPFDTYFNKIFGLSEAIYMPHRLDNFLNRTKQKISEDYKKYPRELTKTLVQGGSITNIAKDFPSINRLLPNFNFKRSVVRGTEMLNRYVIQDIGRNLRGMRNMMEEDYEQSFWSQLTELGQLPTERQIFSEMTEKFDQNLKFGWNRYTYNFIRRLGLMDRTDPRTGQWQPRSHQPLHDFYKLVKMAGAAGAGGYVYDYGFATGEEQIEDF